MPTEYFEQRERALLGPRYEQLYAAPQEAAERGVTVSALRAMPEQFAQKADFPLEVSPFCKAAFVVHAPEFKPGRHPYHHAGVFYSQEPSASSAAPLLGVQPGMRVLDLCAAPGGKSSQLAAALQGRGVLVSNEYVAARAEILKSNLERMGVPNAVVLNETPARIAEALPEFFDRVLVDAPCSGEGMFRKEPVARQQHCEALVKQCAELGAQILDCAAAALAPGGQLVYSTCTFAPEEDEGQVAAFLQRHPEFELADALGNVDYTFGSEGEANRTGGLPLDVRKVRRIWPCQGGEGHFMARLVKAGTPRTLPAAGECTPEELLWLDAAAAAGVDAARGRAAVKSAIEHGYFGADAYIDNRTDTLVVRGAAPQPKKPAQAPTPKAHPAAEDEYAALLRQLREVNDAIPDPVMSQKISRLEEVSGRIFALAQKDPDKKAQLQKFMNYYLPTALKLLNTYASLSGQAVEGTNITEAKHSIERSMDLLVTAFENQLDKLFQADALDVNADIAALEGMLNLDGLTGSEFTR